MSTTPTSRRRARRSCWSTGARPRCSTCRRKSSSTPCVPGWLARPRATSTTRRKYPAAATLQLPAEQQGNLDTLLQLGVRSASGKLVPIRELVTVSDSLREQPIYHKDLLPVNYVVADMAGRVDSPLYGMFAMRGAVRGIATPRRRITGRVLHPPARRPLPRLLDQVGRRVANHLRNVPRHGRRLCGGSRADLSAGGGPVRLLPHATDHHGTHPADDHRRDARSCAAGRPVHGDQHDRHDCAGRDHRAQLDPAGGLHQHPGREGVAFKEAVVHSAITRAQPIMLTGLAAMLGAFFILDDPIFNGLAISLIFGIFVSTLLTLVVIPTLYYVAYRKRLGPTPQGEPA